MALRELQVERFRGVRSARVAFDSTTLLIGENESGRSSLLEALALVLSPLGEAHPRLEPWQFHRGSDTAAASGPLLVRVTLAESRAGSWDRPGLEALAPVLGRRAAGPRTLVVELFCDAPLDGQSAAVEAHWRIHSPGGRTVTDDAAALAAVRRVNPLVWLRGGAGDALLSTGARLRTEERPACADGDDGTALLGSLERLRSGATASLVGEIESGYQAAARLLEQWAPNARWRGPTMRAVVAEILGRPDASAGAAQGPATAAPPAPGSTAQKLGVFLLTARLFDVLRSTEPGARPTIVIEEPEAGLHPMTLASLWGLLERLSAQKVVATNSGTLLAATPLRSLRRLIRDAAGNIHEWRVRPGSLRPDDLRKVGYHLRARRGAACFARCWLLVEGETEFWLLPDLGRLLGYDLAQEGVACVEFAQCGLAPLVKLAQELRIEWHVLTDGDRAGDAYAGMARAMLCGEDEVRRLTRLPDRDIEHCFWRHGHARVFEKLAGLAARAGGATPRRVIEKAIARRSKPGVAFELLASAAAPRSAGVPPPLRRSIETCVMLARGTAPDRSSESADARRASASARPPG